jgi:hypothetical protein
MVRIVVLLDAVYCTRKSSRLENAQGGQQSLVLGSGRGSVMVLDSNIMLFCWSHYRPSWLKGGHGQVRQSDAFQITDVISEQCCNFPKMTVSFIHTAGTVRSWFEEHEGELQPR